MTMDDGLIAHKNVYCVLKQKISKSRLEGMLWIYQQRTQLNIITKLQGKICWSVNSFELKPHRESSWKGLRAVARRDNAAPAMRERWSSVAYALNKPWKANNTNKVNKPALIPALWEHAGARDKFTETHPRDATTR